MNPSGQIGARPGPSGQEMTYTVRAHGRLQTRRGIRRHRAALERRTARSSASRTSPASSSARSTTSRSAASTDSPASASRSSRRPGRTRSRSPRASASRWTCSRERFPNDLDFVYTLDTTLPVSAGHQGDPQDAGRSPRPRHHRRLPVPAELAGNVDSDARGAGVADRHVCRLSLARLFDQHAVAVRSRAGHRPGRRRRHRRGRSGGAPHRRRACARWTRR